MDGSDHDHVGTRFAGRYDVAEVLGQGGMGAVFRARHAYTGAEVALKIMHKGVALSKNARERFLREAQAPSSIGHPGIVKVTDAGVADDGTLYLALELLDGEDLGKAVERGVVDGAAVVRLSIELLDMLGAAHGAGLVHRDIKPENVFLCRNGLPSVRLLDFGITRQLNDTADDKLTRTGTILGTPHYMSPEQARGQPVDARSDLFSVGGMMFFALTGRPPFVAENYNLLIVAIMTHAAPSIRSVRPDVPKDIAAVVDRALAHDVGARFSSAHEMRDALVACAPADLPAVRPPSAEMGLEPTMPSDAGIPVVSTPIRHATPSPLSPGITTQPEPAKTPPSGAPPARAIPPTMGTPIIAAAPTASTKGSRTSLVVGLVVLLGAVVGGTIAAFLLISPDAAEEPPPPAFVTTQPSVSADAAMQPSTSADAAMQPSAPADSVEARIAELEERARRAEADAVEAERQRAEEEEARAEAARRAQKRRAAERADLDAMRQAAVQRCQIDCQMQLGRCQRESGGMGREGLECHTAWTRCRNGCDPP